MCLRIVIFYEFTTFVSSRGIKISQSHILDSIGL